MSTLAEIERVVPNLTVDELTKLEGVVRRALDERRKPDAPSAAPPARTMGLHAGVWSIDDDFDAPLPDEFWLGNDA